MKKKSRKSLIFIFLFIIFILFFSSFSFSQTSQKGNQDKPLSEEDTKAGTNPTQTEGKIQDTNLGEKGGKKQDIGGLVGIKTSETQTPQENFGDEVAEKLGGIVPKSELKGQNIDFKREKTDDKQKITLTPNNNLGGESKVELNENEFSNKEPEGNLGEKSKFVIEKKDDEKYAESSVGTKYTVKGGEDEKENAKDELAGREIELSKDTQVEIKEGEDGNKLVELRVPEGGTIKQPGERKNGEEEENKETNYKWNGLNLKWTGEDNIEHVVNGELFWNQKNGFYVPSGKNTNINGIDVQSTSTKGNFDTQIFSDGRIHPEATKPYVSLGEDNLITVSNGEKPGPLLEFKQNNRYGINIDSEKDIFRMQADSGGTISLTKNNLNNQGNSVDIYGKGTIVDGDRYYVSDGYRTNIIKESNLAGATPVSTEIIPRSINGGDSLLGNNKRWQINGENNDLNQASISQGVNNNLQNSNPLQYQGTNNDPRIGQNLIRKNKETEPQLQKALDSIRLWGSPTTGESGWASSDNFIFTGADEHVNLRKETLEVAEITRSEAAKEWLGQEMPNGKGKGVIIFVPDPDYSKDITGLTHDMGREKLGEKALYHINIYSEPEVIDNKNKLPEDFKKVLEHEVVHSVLAEKLPFLNSANGEWVHEGIATQYNKGDKIYNYIQGYLIGWANGKVPPVTNYQDIITGKEFFGEQYTSGKGYAIATSTLDYLQTINPNKVDLVNTAVYARKNGWDAALQKYYNIQNTGQLESGWKNYVQQNYAGKSFADVESQKRFEETLQQIKEDQYFLGKGGLKNQPYDLADPDWRSYVKQRDIYETAAEIRSRGGKGFFLPVGTTNRIFEEYDRNGNFQGYSDNLGRKIDRSGNLL